MAALDAISTHSVVYWSSAPNASTPADTDTSMAMSESLFLAKAFANLNSMHPMKIIPFFYRATDHFDDDDISVTTLVTSDRFDVLRRLAEDYEGLSARFLPTTIHP